MLLLHRNLPPGNGSTYTCVPSGPVSTRCRHSLEEDVVHGSRASFGAHAGSLPVASQFPRSGLVMVAAGAGEYGGTRGVNQLRGGARLWPGEGELCRPVVLTVVVGWCLSMRRSLMCGRVPLS